jgi:ankyrin repeat protein
MAVFDYYLDQIEKDCTPSDVSDFINGKSKKTNLNVCLSAPVKNNQLDMVKRLLKHGADPNITGTNDKSHLLQAVVGQFYDSVVCLLDAGVNPNHHQHCDDNGNSPLHLAIQNEKITITKRLLDAGANVNAVNKQRQNPFHYAIMKTMEHQTRDFTIERLLLKAGLVDINATDLLGKYKKKKMNGKGQNEHNTNGGGTFFY